jgi:hypothetical protein
MIFFLWKQGSGLLFKCKSSKLFFIIIFKLMNTPKVICYIILTMLKYSIPCIFIY